MAPTSPDDLAAPALRSALQHERARRDELERDNARLKASLARQNERVADLEAGNAEFRHALGDLRSQLSAVLAQNRQVLEQVGRLQAENAQLRAEIAALRGSGGDGGLDGMPGLKPPRPTGQRRPRRRRAEEHNHGRHRMDRVDRVVPHAMAVCPACGRPLHGGWIHRRVQVIELPPQQPVVVTEHQLLARSCARCHRRVLPPPPRSHRVGQHRFGPRLMAAIATMRSVQRLPVRQIQVRLRDDYGLWISEGGLVGLLQATAQHGQERVERISAQIRGSPVVHADETGWREDGSNGYLWVLHTPEAVLFHRDPRRDKAACDRLLGQPFGGTLVTDFYAAYDHVPCPHQRCWSHLWRDIQLLGEAWPEDEQVQRWIGGMQAIYRAAMGERPRIEQGTDERAVRARMRRAQQYERQVLLLCPAVVPADRPEAVLMKRCRRYVKELFTFVRDPGVPPTNNAAERILRPLVVARKISGGTRSPAGTRTQMTLATIAATARLQGHSPHHVFEQILTQTE